MRILLATTFLLFVGCSAIQQAKLDATACLNDPACKAEAMSQAKIVKEVASTVPVPMGANAVGLGAYGVTLLIALVLGGKKKREER